MDPNSGRLYSEEEIQRMNEKDRARMVRIEGSKPDLERISNAVNLVYVKELRAKARAKGKQAKASRKKNRRR